MRFLFKKSNSPKYNIGIVLSGGGNRGIAHLGVLKALNEKGFHPEVISGTSAGAISGAFYADGFEPEEILEIFQSSSLFDFARIAIPRKGFFSIHKVSDILKKNLRSKRFEDLKIPLFVAATNLNDGITEYFNSGDLVEKVVASASIPILFNPTILNGKTFVDGGVLDNLPIYPVKSLCKKIIASHVNPISQEKKLDNILKITERTFHLAIGSTIKEKAKLCDLFIEPKGLRKYGLFSFDKAKEIFDKGYETAIELIELNNFH